MKKQSSRIASSKPRAIQTSRHFRMSHHRHSGHVLPKRSTSYPMLIMIVLCTGVFLASWTHLVTADQGYAVQARVPGSPPATAATISSPITGSTFTTKPIAVSGACPQSTYVELLRNNVSSGIALCSAGGDYSLNTDLSQGENVLIAKVYSMTDLPGPDSNEVRVTYALNTQVDSGQPTTGTPSTSFSSPTSTPPNSPASSQALYVSTDYQFKGYNIGDLASWQLEIGGGTAPYAISVDWGDGEHSLYSRASKGQMMIDHRYKKASDPKDGFVIKVSVTDNNGVSTYLEFFTIVNDPSPAAAVTSLKNLGGLSGPIATLSSGQLGNLIRYAWPSYGVVMLMLTSFWLGELREVRLLKLHPRKIRR